MAKVWPVVMGLAAAFLALGLVVTVNARENRIPSEEELPDQMLVNKTKELGEVRAFLAKYPGTGITVDRSGRLAVDYKQEYREVTLNRTGAEYHLAWIFMSPEGEPRDMFADCRDIHDGWTMIQDDIAGYLKTESCFR